MRILFVVIFYCTFVSPLCILYPNTTIYNPFPNSGESALINEVIVKSLKSICPNRSVSVVSVSQDSGLVLWKNAKDGKYLRDGSAWINIAIPNHPLLVLTNKTSGWLTLDEMKPIYIHSFTPNLILVPKNGSIKNMDDLLTADREGKLKLTSNQNPTIDRLRKLYGLKSNVEFVETSSIRVNMLQNGSVNAAVISSMTTIQLNWVIPIVVASPFPMVEFPDTPTFRELGMEIVDGSYRGFSLPPGTSKEVRNQISDLLDTVMRSIDTINNFRLLAATPSFVSENRMAKFWESQIGFLVDMMKPINDSTIIHTSTTSNSEFKWWIIVVSVSCILLFALSTLMLLLYLDNQRKIAELKRCVPKGHVALVFTDIQGSTTLWEGFHDMPSALEIHNHIIRECANMFDGYEVKTVGDSFFLTFGSVDKAIEFALEAQISLLHAHWPDELYRFPNSNIQYASEGGIVLWRGLRVRIGIHVGDPQVKFNNSTMKADYLGNCVNVAARVESKAMGGQICITEDVANELSHHIMSKAAITSMGMQRLKGISQPILLQSVVPTSLQERTFGTTEFQCPRCDGPGFCSKCDNLPDNRMDSAFTPATSATPFAAAHSSSSTISSNKGFAVKKVHTIVPLSPASQYNPRNSWS